ncbi:hypothetical protein VN97_g6086 [Penicillium thymicola]|uniref:Uncharacterized protein n=1 Tax=Penicillium thymicola TaxID=293382 RepID=A0AAI9X7U4_PENTH|nr:hypothetical protein VN97_g6086 [Penicillium thymicola]
MTSRPEMTFNDIHIRRATRPPERSQSILWRLTEVMSMRLNSTIVTLFAFRSFLCEYNVLRQHSSELQLLADPFKIAQGHRDRFLSLYNLTSTTLNSINISHCTMHFDVHHVDLS